MLTLLLMILFLIGFVVTNNIYFLAPVIILLILAMVYGESEYKCTINNCNKRFKTLSEMLHHLKKDHIKKDDKNA